jgi:ferrous iron transport protein A
MILIVGWTNVIPKAVQETSDISLNNLPIGQRARIKMIKGDRAVARRLLSLGLRVGSEISVLQHRGQGVVVASAGTRVALGGSIASQLILQLIDNLN